MSQVYNRMQGRDKKYWGIFLFVLLILFCFYPYEFYTFYLTFLPEKSYVTASQLFVLAVFVFSTIKGSDAPLTKSKLLTVVMMQLIGFYLVGLIHVNILPAIGITPFILLAVVLVLIIENTLGLYHFFERYNKWILIMAILGVVTWALVTFFHFGPFYIVEDRADGRFIANYGLTFSKYKEYIDMGALRFAGFFDEPGAMAYWGIFALVFNKLFIKDRKLEIVLSICLILTFSVGYYIQLIAYFVLFSIGKVKPGQVLLTLAILGALAFGIYNTRGSELEAVYDMTFGRFEEYGEQANDNGGTLEVGNRAVLTANAKKMFQENMLFGADAPVDVEMGNNIYEPLARYGIVGTFFVYFPFIFMLYFGFKFKNREIWKCALVLILGCLHRPFHSNLLSFFIIYSLILMCIQANKQRKAAVLK